MQHGARRRESERACTHAFLDDAPHFLDVLFGRDRTGALALAEHVGPHRTVRHMRTHIDGARQFLQSVEILGEGFPVPFHPFGQRGAGNVLDAFHQADEPFMLVALGGCETDAAIAHDDRRHAMPARRRHFLVPGRLAIVMRMDVDKAGCDQMTARIDLLGGIATDFSNLGNEPVLDGDIAGKPVLSGSIDDGPVADDQIICGHVCAPLSTEEGLTMQPMSPASCGGE